MHGGDIYRNQVKYDFSVNVNPLGMPAVVRRALKKSLSCASRYPDPRCQELRNALAERHGVHQDQIVCGNGASELITAVLHAIGVLKTSDTRPAPAACRAVIPAPSFTGYRRALKAAGAQVTAVPVAELQQQVSQLKPDLCIVTNPNNPDGSIMGRYQVELLANTCRETGTLLLLDECFIELSDRGNDNSFVPVLASYDGVMILRAFTKSYGLAGIRLGYILTEAERAKKLSLQLPEWNVSVPAQMAGVVAAREKLWLKKTVALVTREREYLGRELAALGCQVYPSHANFLLFHLDHCTDLQKRLLEKGFLIRDCADYDSLRPGYYRVAVKTHRENRKLIRAMGSVLAAQSKGGTSGRD